MIYVIISYVNALASQRQYQNGGKTMLEKFLHEELSYPPDELTLVFYNIRCEQSDLSKHLVYNSRRQRLEFPLSELGSNWVTALKEKFYQNSRFKKQYLKGTKIRWWIDSDTLCFQVI